MNYASPATPSQVCAEAERRIKDQVLLQERLITEAQANIVGLHLALDQVQSMLDAFDQYQPVADPFE